MSCARCRRKLQADTSVYSRHSHQHYCADVNACSARAARQKKASA